MSRKYFLTGSFAFLGILILILDGKTALSGARTGIDLCIRTVIPSLFPFFLLSILLTSAFSGSSLSLLSPIAKLCGMPEGTESILISGFLGGYPVGAQSISAAFISGNIKKEDADRMLSFCNNAGPAFLFGMVSTIFPDKSAAFLLWGIHIGSALLVCLLCPSFPAGPAISVNQKTLTLSGAMISAISVMSTVCGWVVLFRVLIAFLDRWFLWLLPTVAQVAVTGLLELSNGCCELYRISDPGVRFVVCSGMLAWGGLCVTLQTHSVAEGLSLKSYLKGKTLQTLLSLLISAAVVLNIWLPVIGLLLLLIGILRKTQKTSGNPATSGV